MKEQLGLIHLYCGDGKGKTTAAFGLALRALGHGLNVGVVQFMKDGDSGELLALRSFPDVRIISGKGIKGFTFNMSEDEKKIVKKVHDAHLREAISWCKDGWCDLLIMDEAVSSVNRSLLDEAELINFLTNKPPMLEVVLTGRNPSASLIELTDYYSEIRKIKHPYDQGIKAREGIEK